MTFMRKILDKLKLDSTRKIEQEQKEEIFQKEESLSKQDKPKNPIKQKRQDLDLERYAVMCNAYLAHEEEMEQYQHFEQQRSIEEIENPDAQTIYFKDGKLYKVYPTDEESWYDARYLVSDGEIYDLESVYDIQRIPIPKFAEHDFMMDGYGITGSLDYVIRMKAGCLYNRKEKELCSACLWKSTELMLANEAVTWQKKDFDRLINWHYELGMFDEAEKAKEYLKKHGISKEEDIQAKNALSKQLFLNTIETCKKLGSDHVQIMWHGGSCGKCAIYHGRVYSISGKDKRFPKLPDFIKKEGRIHDGCRHIITNFDYPLYDKIYFRGKEYDAIKISNRPFVDDRTEEEKNNHEEYLLKMERQERETQQAEEYSRIKGRDQKEYDSIVELLPELAPKSFSGYRRMKTMRTKNFMKIVDAAKQAGIVIDLEE